MEADVLNQILAFLAASVAGYVGYEVHRARESIAVLNTNIEVLLVRLSHHDQRISKLEDKLLGGSHGRNQRND